MTELRTSVDEFLQAFAQWVSDLTILEWVLLAVALAIAAWVVAAVRAATHIGSIEVATIESDDQSASSLLADTARLRERIKEAGFRPPPEVPAGAPKADLLAAVEATEAPQANWVAAVLKLIPWPAPRAYRLTTTVIDRSQVTIWLRPLGAGTPLLETIKGGREDALDEVPRRILMHVAKDAVDVFPAWGQWTHPRALKEYLDGVSAAKRHRSVEAIHAFERALALQPDNALAKLRRLNAREAWAAGPSGSVIDQADVLREYLDLAVMRPELIQARFRSSELAGMVADGFEGSDDETRSAIAAKLEIGADPTEKLRTINQLGIRQTVVMLQAWFVPLVWQRWRYEVEPRGEERRRLLRTFRVSKSCQAARNPNTGARKLAWHRFVVNLRANYSPGDWQVYYNAGCFYALLGDRDKDAYRFLNRALDEGGYATLRTWIRRDPDLRGLRTDTAEWQRLLERRPGGKATRQSAGAELISIVALPVYAAVAVAAVIALLIWPWLILIPLGVSFALVAFFLRAYANYRQRLADAQDRSSSHFEQLVLFQHRGGRVVNR